MKKQILISLILLSSILTINAQIYTPNGTIQGSSGNNNVGIGTMGPIYNLDVIGSIGNTLGIFTNIKSSGYNALTIANNIAGYTPGMTPYTGPLVLTIKTSKGGDAVLYNEIYFYSLSKLQKLNLITYWWSNGTNVYNPIYKASYSGDQIFTKVRFGFYNGNQVLIFGDATTVWANATVAYVKESTQYWSGGYDMSTWTLQPFTGLDTDLTYLQTAEASRDYQLPYWNVSGNNLYNLNTANIGIGTNNPQYKLDVCGTIRAKEVKVDLQGGCDFVFKKGYKLMDLKELESFVTTNQHLPEITPEKEMVENGVNIKDLQMKLLQKIEELTLYTIEQNKKIIELEKQNEKIEQQNQELQVLKEKIAKLESVSK